MHGAGRVKGLIIDLFFISDDGKESIFEVQQFFDIFQG